MEGPTHIDTWISRDLPVLFAAAKAVESAPSDNPAGVPTVRQALEIELPDDQLVKALEALEGEYLELRWLRRGGPFVRVLSLTSSARRVVGMWPNPETLTDRVLQELESRIEMAEPEEKSRLVKIREGLLGGGRDLVVGVLGAVISKAVTR